MFLDRYSLARILNSFMTVTPTKMIWFFLNISDIRLCQSFIACKGVVVPKADCGNCLLYERVP